MSPAKSNKPVPVTSAPAAFIQLLGRMELEAQQEDDDFGSPMIAGMIGILEAATEEEMWDSDELDQTGGRDLSDIEQRIIGYSVRYSNNPDLKSAFRDSSGRGMYLLVKSVRLDNGEEFIWNTSAPLLVGKIFWLVDHDRLPADVVIRARDLGGGQKLLKLKPVPRRAEEPVF